MFKYFIVLLTSVCCFKTCFADDSYDPKSGILSIPIVNVGGNAGTFYSNVQVTVGTILAVNSANRPTPGFDTFDPSSSQLAIPSVTVSGTTYQNVYVTVVQLDMPSRLPTPSV